MRDVYLWEGKIIRTRDAPSDLDVEPKTHAQGVSLIR
jgi:hypothetical protein